MRFDPVGHLKEMMHVRGVGVQIFTPPHDGTLRFDFDLRGRLYGGYDYAGFTDFLTRDCKSGSVYLTNDQFELNYIIFKDSEDAVIIVGPYTVRSHNELFRLVCERLNPPVTRMTELQEYYCGVPLIEGSDILESEVIMLAKYILDTEAFSVERIDLFSAAMEEMNGITEDRDDRLSFAMIEERYQNEDNLLEAVERGDLKQATMYMSVFNKFRMEQRHADSLRNMKNYCLVLNTLLRKAVQRAAVHPAHIHNVSMAMAVRIENVRIQEELPVIIPDMIRKYCLLVNNHSLLGYSLPVRKAVNFIEFNFTEHLTLEQIAETASVNYSYLSSQFKKETGSSVVDYINMKRMRKALALLSATRLSINVIAGKCGYADDNYFTRIFKKKYGKSPREYRKDLMFK